MITIIDYGMGNLRSVQKAFELFYRDVRIASSPKEVLASDKVVLPGVGAFSKAMEELQKRDLIEPVKEVIKKGIPFLGICLGLQLLFSESEEGGRIKGLGILKGRVRRFKDADGFKIPHMGWNKITQERKQQASGILAGVPDESYMYFVHSYFVDPEDKAIILCKTDYIRNFTSSIHGGNIYAFQFHPEKSQRLGLRIIKNFVEL
jgi:glutamine amidotransferase